MSGKRADEFEGPLRVVSDLHLGHPSALVGSVEWLRPLLAGARTVVFNGDTCELAHAPWRASAEELLGLLRNLCDELGVEFDGWGAGVVE